MQYLQALTTVHTGASATVELSSCPDGSWCLGANVTGSQCCNAGEGYFVGLNGEQTKTKPTGTRVPWPTTPTSSSSSQTNPTNTMSTSSVQPSHSSNPTATATTTASHGLSSGAKIGIGVGVGLGVLAIAGLLAGIFMMRRQFNAALSKKEAELRSLEEEKSNMLPFTHSQQQDQLASTPVYQLHGNSVSGR